MSFDLLTSSFPWTRYSKKLGTKIEKPHNVGFFTHESSESRGVRLVQGTEGAIEDGNIISLYLLIDKEDGVIVDAKFQALGQSALIGAAEVACDLLLRKNYDQAKRISADLIDKQVRDRADIPAFPQETALHLNLVLEAIKKAAEQCIDIPLPFSYVAPPAPLDIGEIREGGYPGWQDLSLEQKLNVIEEIIEQDIRPYITLDGGGIELTNFLHDKEVVITYKGNCTSCFSSIGATLSYIQQVIRAKIHPDLTVIPNLDGTLFQNGAH
jgi:NifU-like protein